MDSCIKRVSLQLKLAIHETRYAGTQFELNLMAKPLHVHRATLETRLSLAPSVCGVSGAKPEGYLMNSIS